MDTAGEMGLGFRPFRMYINVSSTAMNAAECSHDYCSDIIHAARILRLEHRYAVCTTTRVKRIVYDFPRVTFQILFTQHNTCGGDNDCFSYRA